MIRILREIETVNVMINIYDLFENIKKRPDEFQEWIQNKYHVKASKSWATIILESSTNETEAFYKFFELLEEFRNEIRKTSKE